MTYRVNRAAGHRPWGVTNPWVFANYGQPQRKRGYVSPMVFQTAGPYLKSAHLGQLPDDLVVAQTELRRANAELKRSERMEKFAMAGLVMSGASLLLAYQFYKQRTRVAVNRRRRGRSRKRRTSRR